MSVKVVTFNICTEISCRVLVICLIILRVLFLFLFFYILNIKKF